MVTLKLTLMLLFSRKNTYNIYVIYLINVVKKFDFTIYRSICTYLFITQTIVLIVGEEK